MTDFEKARDEAANKLLKGKEVVAKSVAEIMIVKPYKRGWNDAREWCEKRFRNFQDENYRQSQAIEQLMATLEIIQKQIPGQMALKYHDMAYKTIAQVKEMLK